MTEERIVHCKKLGQDLPGLRYKPFTDDFGKLLYDNVSQQAWQMWLQESPRYVNTYGLDLQSKEGKEFLRQQMKLFFGFEDGAMADTAWKPPSEE